MTDIENKCEICAYKKDVVDCLSALNAAVEQMDTLISQSEELKKSIILIKYKALCQKKEYEKIIRENMQISEHAPVETADIKFQKELIQRSETVRAHMKEEKSKLVAQMRTAYAGKRVLFVLPMNSECGGGIVIANEAKAMREFGVDAQILNYIYLKSYFEKAYGHFQIPTIYVESLDEAVDYAKDFDVTCATAFNTVGDANFIEIQKNTTVAYYVQDYEPFFCDEGTDTYRIALESYTIVPKMQCVTKTKWNRDKVKENTGKDCTLLVPSVCLDIFYPQKSNIIKKDKIVITAMVRYYTPRRNPEETMRLLQKIFWSYGDVIEIHIFGSDEAEASDFFIDNNTNFQYVNHGCTSSEQTAELLSYTDIFIDISGFQAMGLTAMEAMASGCAVIVPQNGGSDSFAEHEKNALIIDTADFESCYAAAIRLIEDRKLRESLSLQAVEDICKYYPERSAAKFLDAVFCDRG